MTTTDAAAARYIGTRVQRVEDARLLTRSRHLRRRRRPPRDGARMLRSGARTRGRASAASTPPRRVRCPAYARCSLPAISTPVCTSSGTRRWGRTSPTRPDLRWPTTKCASSGTRLRWSSPSNQYVAEDAVDLVDIDYEPLAPVVDYCVARTRESLVHSAYRGQRGRRPRRCRSATSSSAVFESAAHDVAVTIHQQAYVPVPMETRGMIARVVRRGAHRLGRDAGAARGPHVPRPPARDRRAPGARHHARHRRRASVRRSSPCARTCASRSAAMKLSSPLKWIEDRRENLLAGGHGPSRARRRADRLRRRRPHRGRLHRPRPGHRRVPDAVAGRHRCRRRHAVPGAVPRARSRDSARRRCSPTRPVGRRTAAHGSSNRSPAKSCSTSQRAASAWIRSNCGAGTCSGRTSCPA